ncbi:MAG: DUF2141 domain-containing protein [Candidatus Marithrix sp.]|nr:DUF2141 domain-containing protein [Candidatus Marithrix sp.]
MKKFNIINMVIFFTIFASTVYAQSEVGIITVEVTQIDVKESGKVKIGIYDSTGFPIIGKEIVGVDLLVTKTSITHIFKEIPIGQYGIAVFQDKNNDGKLNKNLFGVPTELYGFSKNIYGIFGPPDFGDISFVVKEKDVISLIINLE